MRRKKARIKKLKLSRTTVRELTDEETARVGGAVGGYTNTCATFVGNCTAGCTQTDICCWWPF